MPRLRVGIPLEIKEDERRVASTPAGVRELAEHGHDVLVETLAGALRLGVNVASGRVTSRPVAEAHSLDYTPIAEVRLGS
jgi:alanine dehydrogenase